MLKRKFLAVLVASALAAGSYFGSTALYHSTSSVWADGTTTAKPTAPVAPEAVSSLSDLSRAFRAVHNSIKDAVVNIHTVRAITATAHGNAQIPDELRKMLPPDLDPLVPEQPEGRGGHSRVEGTGSGVIVSADGYILTNNHVVEDSDKIVVRLDDGRELDAKIIGRDPKTDLAVVKINAEHLTYAKFGDSDALQVGDWVLAFGSPFGFEQTMTQGIISAKGRQNVNIIASNNPALQGLTYENFLQTDAAINPGNSGGPLVNLNGEVIGVDSAIASNTGAYNGIGFAIPSNDAKYVMDSLIKNGKVVRGYMGVGIGDVKDAKIRPLARSFGYEGNAGVLVDHMYDDSPGAKGGLKRGDIITAINGKPVENITELRTTVARTAPGANITLSVFRNGKTLDVTFPVGTQPDSAIASAPETHGAGAQPGLTFESSDLGISVSDITPDLAGRLGVKAGSGVVITDVDPQGQAVDLGLGKGDVITNVHGADVHNTQEFKAALKKHKLSDGIRLSVRDPDGTDRFVFLQKQ
jgi:serine protease Do